ncbi:MAG: YfcE family phosphodiesterase [Eubacteriales bacterium]|nr:YfcE family phosphodiesterase [Eubacteriales bacterium]
MDAVLNHLESASAVRLLVVSDSHGRTDGIATLIQQTGLPDLLIHLGDHQDPLEEIAWELDCPVLGVAGNCDHWQPAANLPENRLIILAGQRFFLTHGHRYQVKSGLNALIQTAVQDPWRADFILFGHTHQQRIQHLVQGDRPVVVINPGSAYPGREGPHGVWIDLAEGKIRIDPLPDSQRP